MTRETQPFPMALLMEEKIYTITELTRLIKRNIEDNPDFTSIWVKGEISNITYHSSGHIYFTLKDEGAIISSAFFRNVNKALSFRLEEGMSIIAFGSISVFEKRGSYQLIVAQVRLEGIGELQKRIEQLKKKLLAEGIFDPRHKKKIPFLPKRIGIVTSPTGAAVRDIIKVAMRRYPNIEIVLAPAKVQGDDAAVSIAMGIAELNRPEWGVDVIICGRGGGSFEDLMPFNEEIVVRAFYASRTPIISAVGHQIDHPLSDDAADYAAPTPSAAAEIAVPIKKDLHDEIDYYILRAYNSFMSRIRELQTKLKGITSQRSFRSPGEIVYVRELLLSDVEGRILSVMKDIVNERRNRLSMIPDLTRTMFVYLRDKNFRFNRALNALETLSPLGVMKRGYAIAVDRFRAVVKSVALLEEGDAIELLLADGSAGCTVNSIHREAPFGKKIDTKEQSEL